jgi:HTH-type transcriptional regulator, cell division transcriptional repressor
LGKLAEQFGRVVRARRKARGMTQARLAEACNLGEEWIRRIERGAGAPSFDAIEALASGLDASVADLFAPMSSRDSRATKIDGMIAKLDEHELAWLEGVIRAAMSYPTLPSI